MTFKQKIYRTFLQNLNDKIANYQLALDDLKASVSNETKSTAGDKHETALAMLQAEQSRIANHMQEALEARNIFSGLNTVTPTDRIRSGCLVKTDRGYFFIGVALPKITIEEKTILAISPLSPLGAQLIGKRSGDEIILNQIQHHIEEVA